MHKRYLALAALGGLTALSACTSGQSAIVPPSTAVNLPATAKLQLAVGTANINGAFTGLNTVVTFRQTNGLSATLVNTPTLTGPAGFTVPVSTGFVDPNSGIRYGASGTDANTNHISGSPQVASGTAAIKTTFGQSGGAYAYGFAPDNTGTSGAAIFDSYPLPFYADTVTSASLSPTRYLIGPGNSYVSNFRDGTQAPGFAGYASGFTDFAVAPVAGSYSLTVHVGTANGSTIPDFAATANLASIAALPTFATPVYTTDGAGGGSIAVNVPAGVTEALVFVVDGKTGNYYTLLTRASGAQTLVLPANLGPVTGGKASATIPVGNPVTVFAAGFDYPAIEAAPIGSAPAQSPKITGANGQADVTTSDPGDPAATTTE